MKLVASVTSRSFERTPRPVPGRGFCYTLGMKNYVTWSLVLVVLPILSAVYYFVPFGSEVDKIFLSISTFLYSIFTGFFISRQAARFNKVRETVTRFDGVMSNIYRTSIHVSKELQDEVGKVIENHYKRIFETKQWDYHFKHKSTTITSLHALLEEKVDDESVTKVSNQALGSIIKGLGAAQDIRKSMVALSRERIPSEQWILIVFFVVMLIGTVSTLASVGLFFPSILKAAFVVTVLSVMYILYRLNNLIYTEDIMGADSAQDVLDIIANKK